MIFVEPCMASKDAYLQAPQIGVPIMSWHLRQYNSVPRLRQRWSSSRLQWKCHTQYYDFERLQAHVLLSRVHCWNGDSLAGITVVMPRMNWVPHVDDVLSFRNIGTEKDVHKIKQISLEHSGIFHEAWRTTENNLGFKIELTGTCGKRICQFLKSKQQNTHCIK